MGAKRRPGGERKSSRASRLPLGRLLGLCGAPLLQAWPPHPRRPSTTLSLAHFMHSCIHSFIVFIPVHSSPCRTGCAALARTLLCRALLLRSCCRCCCCCRCSFDEAPLTQAVLPCRVPPRLRRAPPPRCCCRALTRPGSPTSSSLRPGSWRTQVGQGA